jgi:hypothetical protein
MRTPESPSGSSSSERTATAVLRSNVTGLGEFQLGDGTKLVLGRNASIVVDRYVTGRSGTAKAVSLRIVSGSVRFLAEQATKRLTRSAHRKER